MSEEQPTECSESCERCGNPVPAGSPHGICPFCALLAVSRDLRERAAEEEDLRPEIAGYEIGALLGRGGMGDVFLATEKKLGRRVAIKVIRPAGDRASARHQEVKARFLAEARTLSALSHPSIVPIFAVGELPNGEPYFVMEYVEGSNLGAILRKGPLDRDTLLEWALQICAALEYAHARGILHRDIKPANVLVANGDFVKVVDFGLAKHTPASATPDLSVTFSQLAAGTPDYMAPEQTRSPTEADERSDVYALGVLLYEMATTRIPRGSWARPSRIRPELPRAFDGVVARALEPEPADRFPTIRELRKRLERIHRPRPSPARAALVAVAIAGVGALAFWLALSPWDEGGTGRSFRTDPPPVVALPQAPDMTPEIPRASRPDSLPLRVDDDGEASLHRLVNGKLERVELPESVDLAAPFPAFEWTSPSSFAAPAKDGGIALVDLDDGSHRPQIVLRGLTDVVQIEASRGEGIALRADGEVVAWPAGRAHLFFPPDEPLGGVIRIAAGDRHGAALLRDGSVRVWGDSADGKTVVPHPFDNVVDIDAGRNFTAVLTENGRVFAWGKNDAGQCDVPPDLPAVARMVCLDRAVYVLLENGVLRGWGNETFLDEFDEDSTLHRRISAGSPNGVLLAERTSGTWEPVAGPAAGNWRDPALDDARFSKALDLSINGAFLLARRLSEGGAGMLEAGPTALGWPASERTAKLVCLSRDPSSEAGLGMEEIPLTAERVRCVAVSPGTLDASPPGHVVALTDAGEVVAWGNDDFGQCDPPELGESAIDVAAGKRFSMALTESGRIVVWGASRSRRPLTPVAHLRFVEIAAGAHHGVGLGEDGTVFCWGNDSQGQCSPPDPEARFRLVAAAGGTTMGITTKGEVAIWGAAAPALRSAIPEIVRRNASGVRQIGVGDSACWVLLEDGTLVGWGELPADSTGSRDAPEALADVDRFWCSPSGLIVRFDDGSCRSFGIGGDRELLSNLISRAIEVQITERSIFAAVR